MQRKSFVITAALVIGLTLGVVFSSALRSSIAGAQTEPPAQAQSSSPRDTLWNLFLDNLAEALNIGRSELDTAITNAGTSTADEAVEQGILTQEQADALKARVEAGDPGVFWGGRHGVWGDRGGKFGGPRLHGVRQAMLDAAAQTLNITTDELMTQLHSGRTLDQIAQDHGTTVEAVTDAALAAADTELDQAVADGTLTQAQADEIYARLQEQGAELLDHHGHRHGGRGWRSGPAAPESPVPTPETSDA